MKIADVREVQRRIKDATEELRGFMRNPDFSKPGAVENQGYISMAVVRLEQAEEWLANVKKYTRSKKSEEVNDEGDGSHGNT